VAGEVGHQDGVAPGRQLFSVGDPGLGHPHPRLRRQGARQGDPRGIYDLRYNRGWVRSESATTRLLFAVASLRSWWQNEGVGRYPRARRLLVCADAGGPDSYRDRLWKVELARLASGTGLAITVCHFPLGTSQFNKVEHRPWFQVASNWRGEPLKSREVVVSLIGAMTTRAGLSVQAALDQGTYPSGVKISDRADGGFAPTAGASRLPLVLELHGPPPRRRRATAV
jgi:hypothetical protein